MLPRFTRRLAALFVSCLWLTASAGQITPAEYLGSYTWRAKTPGFGGFSGLEVSDGGMGFTAISDRGALVTGRFRREEGLIAGVDGAALTPLGSASGGALSVYLSDAEGLAIDGQGRIFISFEGAHRVWAYPSLSRAEPLPVAPAFAAIPNPNSGLEALAVDAEGRLYTMPERSGQLTRPFPVYRLEGDTWEQPFSIPRSDGFLMVGADFDDAGRLYVLERGFPGFGFRSRVRRFTLEGDGIARDDTLLSTHTLRHDNLEGLSVWRDAAGDIRLTMISDDNFQPIQRTEFVEYRVREGL